VWVGELAVRRDDKLASVGEGARALQRRLASQSECTILSDGDATDIDELLFKADGHWREAPQDWGSPEQTLNQRQFFEVLGQCMERPPMTRGRVFTMGEWLELGADEICKEVAIASTNLWVLLHRERLRAAGLFANGLVARRPMR
jgi:DNA-directed RNA polymerase specialized sigma24 family protein